MRRTKPAKPADRAARILLLASAVWLVGLGAYFALFRPPLLPEDVRFIGLSTANTALNSPGLGRWLRLVFIVLGGFIAASGFVTAYVALSLEQGASLAREALLAAAGSTGVGLMVVVNFVIGSDFHWLLIGPPLLWAAALACRWRARSPL